MNHIYRLVFSCTLGSWVAVPETVISRGPTRSASRRRAKTGVGPLLALCGALAAPAANAACSPGNPSAGATVTCSGAANPLAPSYSSAANNLTVNVNAGASVGVLLGLGGTAMTLSGNGTTLNNAGTIDPSLLGLLSLLSSGAVIGNPNLGTAISGSTVTVNNLGTGAMRGTTGLLGLNLANFTGMALSVRNGAGGTTTISNAGTIGSNALLGVSVLGADAPVVAAYGGAQINFTNTGTITGRAGFESSAAGNTFVNAGTISGSVSMGTNSTNTFTAVSGSNVNNGGSLGLNQLGVLGVNLTFAPTGQVDGGAGGDNTLVLQNVVAGPGSGTGGTATSASSATYVNFQHLTVNSGTWNLQGALVSGDATLNGGLANVDNGAAFGSGAITANGGAIGASTNGVTLGNAITVNAGGLTASGGNNFTLSGVLSGNGALTKNGAGTLTLAGANSYAGGTVIDGGTIALGAGGSLAPASTVDLHSAGAAFDISGASADQTIGMLVGVSGSNMALGGRTLTFGDSVDATFFGGITGTGGIVKQGSGVFTLAGTNTFTGGTTIDAGTLAIGAGGSLSPAGAVTLSGAGSIFDISNAAADPTVGALSGVAGSQAVLGARTLTLGSAASSTFGGTIGGTGGIVKQGSGTLTLSGANTYTGGTTINAGTLALGSGASLTAGAQITLGGAGSTLDLSAAGAQTLGSLAGVSGSTVDIGANALTLAPSGSATFAGAIGGIGSVVINGTGTQTLAGANTYTGGTRIQAGTLALGAGGSLAAGTSVIMDGGTFDLSAAGNQSIASLDGTGGQVQLGGGNALSVGSGSFAGSIGGAGGLTKVGTGSLVLDGVNNYSGATQVLAGSVVIGSDAAHATAGVQSDVTVASTASVGGFGHVDGNVQVLAGGHLAPGNPQGTFTINGDLDLAQGSQMDLAFGAPGPDFGTPGAGHNVQVNGNLTLSGASLNAGDAGGFGQGLYNLFNYTGTLTQANGGITLPSGFALQTLTASKQINLINTQGLDLGIWNGNGLAGPTQMGGGSGIWSQANANWTNASGSVTATRSPADGFVIFGGSPGQVTVDNAGGTQPVTAQGIQFASSGYRVNGDPLGLVAPSGGGPSEIRVGDGSAASANWTATIDNALTGNGVKKTGAGTLVLTGANTYTQGTQLAGGTLSVSSDANLGQASGSVDFEGGTLRITGTSFTSTARAFNVGTAGGGLDIADAANTFTLGQAQAGAGGLTKLGAGRLVLASANNYTGGTTISGGTLALSGGGSLSATGAVRLTGAGAAFDIGAAGDRTIGALSGVAGASVMLGTHTLSFGDATDQSFAGSIDGAGGLVKQGSGTQTLLGASTYGGGTALKRGTLAVGHGAALGTGTLAMDDDTTLAFATDGLNLANPIRMTGTNDPTIDTGANTATLSGGISGAADLTKAGSGTLILAVANNSYTGATTVAAGTLRAGTANAFSAASAHTVNAGATLTTGGFNQSVASLSNAGTVSLLGTNPGSTLTVTGNYVGNNGVLQIGTVLGDSSSPSDKLVIGGSASGSTTVQVSNFGGLGAQTTGHGIQVVSAAGGIAADAFTLAGGHVDAGAYEYRLTSTADASYLSSTTTVPGASPAVPLPTYRSEVPLLAALPAQLRQASLAMLGNLHQRIGDDDVQGRAGGPSASAGTDGSQRRAWGRVISTDLDIRQSGTVSPRSNGRLDGFQAGTDLWASPSWRAGLYVGQLDGTLDVNGFARGIPGLGVGNNDLRSQYLAAYGTYASEGGFYADAVLQAGRHRYDVNPTTSFRTHGKGSSLLASVEIGQRFDIAPNWQIEPQLQLVHQHQTLDDLLLSGATIAQQHPDNSWLARLGVRVKGDLGTMQPYARFNVYRASAGTDVASFVGPAAATGIATRTGSTSTELAAGATLKLSDSTSLYGEVGKLWASGGDARVKSSAQGSLGVRVRW